MKHNINIKNVEELLKGYSSKELLKGALKIFIPTTKDYKRHIIIPLICIIPAIVIGFSENTVSLCAEVIEKINSVLLALFGIVFTGYAFFQALINKELLLNLLEYEGKDGKSKLLETNEYFVHVMLLQLISIFISLFFSIIIGSVSNSFLMFKNYVVNSLISFSLLWIYLSFIFFIIWELKCFLFNVFQLFNIHAATKFMEYTEDKKEE